MHVCMYLCNDGYSVTSYIYSYRGQCIAQLAVYSSCDFIAKGQLNVVQKSVYLFHLLAQVKF